MAELLLDMPIVDLGRGGEAGAQGMAREQVAAHGIGQVGGPGGALDQAGHLSSVKYSITVARIL